MKTAFQADFSFQKNQNAPSKPPKDENWQSQPPSSAPAGFAKDTRKKRNTTVHTKFLE
jgi:hypothetical protein